MRDGLIWRKPGNLAAYILVNTKNDFVRFRYLHMNPKLMDADGLLSGRAGEPGRDHRQGRTWGDFENGTSYHMHFNIQVFTKVGWVWVNPYMTLVRAYERADRRARHRDQAGRSGAAPVPVKPPLIAHPTPVPEPPATAARRHVAAGRKSGQSRHSRRRKTRKGQAERGTGRA